jgi:hypothetical protein
VRKTIQAEKVFEKNLHRKKEEMFENCFGKHL